MKKIKVALLVILFVLLVFIVVQNTDPVQARFLWFTMEMPVVLLLFLTTSGGFVSGLIVALLVKSGTKSKHK